MEDNADVIIVGAGVAGLAAARDLDAACRRVLVLEARERLGGRIDTVLDPVTGSPVELGAEFVHGRAPELFQPAAQHGWEIDQVRGQRLYQTSSGFTAEHARTEAYDTVLDRMEAFESPDITFREFLDEYARHNSLPEEDRAWLKEYIEGFNAARDDRVSVEWLVRGNQASAQIGDDLFRFRRGYRTVVDWLVSELRTTEIQPSTVVEAVRWSAEGVEVSAGRNYRARQIVIAVPLGVLQAPENAAGAIHFEPDLPEKRDAARRLATGEAIRVTLRLTPAFWSRPAGQLPCPWSEIGTLFSHDADFPTWWLGSQSGRPLITAWSASRRAVRLSRLTNDEIGHLAVAALARVIGCSVSEVAMHVETTFAHNWQTDPFSRGAYSYVPSGATGAVRILGEPVQETLFFAGEATHTEGRSGTVDGAIATGRRAAREALSARK